ncbi:glycosyltransferase family 4 protein [Haloarcula onubensis]|uniref:Glycosyltransferase family 4 protein n=1 Tax=Haloarcula onubensis TaxID=2950539 RepID=A0ABU2FMQ8_9EURY|nr:glycosyltransferase family 4 protein [Halomicroarcula sp. S3CR25-11]MDS0281591.1 glycosyltransferase family 4 protein [Halomicroarcula sp. S3CR25-11]
MTREVLAIGPRSPPITGPGLKNRYIQRGLEGHGLDVEWVNTLETHPRTVADILTKTLSYDAYLLSASTKVRLGVAPLLATKLRSPGVHGALFPAGGEFADELRALPGPARRFYRRTFSAFDGVYPQTDELTDDLSGLLDDSVQVRTVPNLRPLPESTPSPRPSGTLQLAYVGRIKESKGLDDLLDAYERARDAGADAVLDIYGHFLPDDPYEDHFLDRCSRVPGARFHGKLPNEDVIPTLQEADAFVFPTVYDGEGFPGALVEAFAAGCPVLATDWNFNADIVTDGVDGRLFDPRDAAALADIIGELAADSGRLADLQRGARATGRQYSVERVTAGIVEHLDESGWDIPSSTAEQSGTVLEAQ